LPPTRSGIADYSRDLLEHLGDRYDIELVVDPCEPVVTADLTHRHRVLTAAEVRGRHEACPFDLFVYHMGNSHFHVYMLDLMRRFRSLVVLHDSYLGGLVLPAVQAGLWPVALDEELEAEGEPKVAAALRRQDIGEFEAIEHSPLNRRVLGMAGAVIVHSAWSWRHVRGRTSVPVARVPMMAPLVPLKSRAEERTRLGLPSEAFLIATLGFVGPPKRLPALLRAVAALPEAARRKTRLLVVGYAPPELHDELVALASELGIAPLVRMVGRVSFGDFTAYARAADVCVQLRYPTRGESSAALLRELAAGATCVISDHGSMSEVPDGVALKVRTPRHEVEDLTAALTRLYEEPGLRSALGEAAVRFVADHHSVGRVVEGYTAMVELAAVEREARDARWAEGACDALAAAGAAAEPLIAPWAALRVQRQQAVRGRRSCVGPAGSAERVGRRPEAGGPPVSTAPGGDAGRLL
jgi:glycosyltransferase involved in cell wall biosynthesis